MTTKYDFSTCHQSCQLILEEFSKRFENFKDKKELLNFKLDPVSCAVENCHEYKAEFKTANKDNNILIFFKNLDSEIYGNIRNLAL